MGMKLLKIKYHVMAMLRRFLYVLLFGSKFQSGGGTTWRKFFNIYLEDNAKIEIGRNCFFNHGCSINALESITIGDNCIFGENVKIYDHNHRFADKDMTIKNQGYTTSPVNIGNKCWIGSNVIILKGTEIGNSCVIGAGCVVTGRIPDYSIVTSNRELNIERMRR